MIRVTFVTSEGERVAAEGAEGAVLLEIAQGAGMPLEGTCEGQMACSTCHVGEGFAGLDMSCQTCHEAERPPYHYPGDCDSCHPISAWPDGVVHRVPLPHHTAVCASCHPDAAVRTTFDCLDGCHLAADTDPLHVAVPGYVRDSTFCADCHFPP